MMSLCEDVVPVELDRSHDGGGAGWADGGSEDVWVSLLHVAMAVGVAVGVAVGGGEIWRSSLVNIRSKRLCFLYECMEKSKTFGKCYKSHFLPCVHFTDFLSDNLQCLFSSRLPLSSSSALSITRFTYSIPPILT